MKIKGKNSFYDEIKKRSLKSLIEIVFFYFIIGWVLGEIYLGFSIVSRTIFPFSLISRIFLIILGIALIFIELTSYKKYKIYNWIPLPILINAFISGITLPMMLSSVYIQSVRIFFANSGLLAFFMLWFFGRATLDGLIEMKKIKLGKKTQIIISIISWLFYFILILFLT